MTSAATAARERVGLSLAEAAKRGRMSVAYLNRLERSGDFPLVTAERLSRMYQCPLSTFLAHQGSPKSEQKAAPEETRSRRGSTKPVLRLV